MFITLTIDTNRKNKTKLRMHKQKFNLSSGWRRALHIKKRTMWQKIKAWRKDIKGTQYKLDGQIAML